MRMFVFRYMCILQGFAEHYGYLFNVYHIPHYNCPTLPQLMGFLERRKEKLTSLPLVFGLLTAVSLNATCLPSSVRSARTIC